MNFCKHLACSIVLAGSVLTAQERSLDPTVKAKVSAASFEVVVLRPDPGKDPVSYERELPWDLVPFNIRNDSYISIGTAFAISNNQLVTAHHVFQSLHASKGYQTCFIRDSKQKLWEVDQILALDEQRDIIQFTVKGRTFDQWLDLRQGFQENEAVFAIGNAYGEGLVIRPGEVIGTTPEPLRGAWNLLKSSTGVNPGNSGGPLVDPQGNVLGVVLQKKDNICYSLPTQELLAIKPRTAAFYNKVTFSFSLVPERSKALERIYDLPLPKPYADLRIALREKELSFYRTSMDGLFRSLGEELFPAGESSEEAIFDVPTSIDPEVIFRDNTTKKWSLSGLEFKKNKLPRNGKVSYAQAAGVYLFLIHQPDGEPLGDLISKPKASMDLLLKGASVTRTVGGQNIRVTSFGDPYQIQAHVDRFGRPWQQAIWFTAYDDGVILTYSTLVPSGIVMVARFVNSTSLDEWLYDLPKFLDYTYVPYAGTLKEWQEFSKHRTWLPAAFRDLSFDFAERKHLKIQALWANVDLKSPQVELSSKDFLSLCMGFSRRGSEVVWDLRRLSIAEDEEDNYFVLLKHIQPTSNVPDSDQTKWKELSKQRHPYTQRSFEEEGASRIAALHPASLKPGVKTVEASELFTVYLARVGKVEEQEMKDRLQDLLKSLRPSTAPSSVYTSMDHALQGTPATR